VEHSLPSVGELLAHPGTERLLIRFNREGVMQGYRDILAELQRAVSRQQSIDPAVLEADAILARLESRLVATDDAWLQRVVNATGDILQTGLGGALLPAAAIDALLLAAAQPVTLEYDLAQGAHGRREQSVEHLLMDLTGAEAATVVNNTAAAVWLALNTLANGKVVIVSRGDLLGAGATCGLPSIVAASGAQLEAVGTSDRASASDFEAAITERTGLLLHMHTGDSQTIGAGGEVELADLVAIGHRRGIPVVEHLERSTLVDLGRCGLPKEAVVAERIACGADVVIFSGDGLVGGPEAGLVVGSAAFAGALSKNALHRALQCGKLTVAALEATLRLYRESAYIALEIPTLMAMTRSLEDVEDTARRALPALASALGPGFRVSVRDRVSHTGIGTPHRSEIPTKAIAVEHDFLGGHRIAGRFRQARPPIIGRVEDDLFMLDARTVLDPLDLVPNWSDEVS
jgi:L-seryl-tRNA(Ser) seleniumtransferase